MSTTDEPLNLKEFIADLDLPVIVGGCTDYKTALHLMRTGAAGVIVGVGADEWSTTDTVLGIRVPMATAIADAAAARRDYLDETGGRYVHLIADGGIQTSGDIAKAIGCGADAVMLGEPLSLAEGAPAGGAWWHSAASHPSCRAAASASPASRTARSRSCSTARPTGPDGQLNLFGGLAPGDGQVRLPRRQGIPEGRPGPRPLRSRSQARTRCVRRREAGGPSRCWRSAGLHRRGGPTTRRRRTSRPRRRPASRRVPTGIGDPYFPTYGNGGYDVGRVRPEAAVRPDERAS